MALKLISQTVTKDHNALKRFQREVVAAAKLNHPNIVGAFDADEHKGTHFLVMEFVDGSDLAALVKQHGPFPIVQAVECIAQAARGLEFAHREGVVHRDIKPHNLLLARESSTSDERAGGVVKILDMGLARIDNSLSGPGGGESASLTQSGTIMGTVDYMSPEQALDTKHADHRADIYSLGITLWYLLTGKPCYDGNTLMKKLLAHREMPIPSLRAARGDVPPGLEAVFQRMVAKRPEDRYQSMTDVLAALSTCLTVSAQIGQLVPSAPATTEDGDLMSFFRGIASETVASRPAPKIAKSTASDTLMPRPQGHTPTPTENTSPATVGQARRKQQMLIGGGVAVVAVLCLAGWLISRSGSDKTVTAAKPANEDIGFEVGKNSGKKKEGKGRNSKTNALSSPSQFALKFDGQSFVEIPSLRWDGKEPVTLEFVVSVDAAEAAIAGSLVLASWISPNPGEELLAYRISNLWAFDARHSDKRWISSIHALRPNERVLLNCIFDGNQTLVVANGEQGNAFESDTNPIPGRPGLWIGGSVGHASQLFRGTIEQVRVSKGVRTALTAPPAGRLPKDSSTIALYHFDEGRGSVLKDSSGNNHHGKITGAKWISATSASAQGHALRFDGDDLVTIDALPEYSTDSLTIEAYVQPESAKSAAWIYSLGSNGGLGIYPNDSQWRFATVFDPSGWFQLVSPEPIKLQQRVHLAGVCDKTEFRLYLDGQLSGVPASSVGIRFRGRQGYPQIGYTFHGIIDELRVSKVARYSKNFTPPSRHELDANTFALYHFDEGSGEVLRDSSSNNHHGKIVGAKWVKVDGSPTIVDRDAGLSGLEFSGQGDHVLLPKLTSQDRPITIEAWWTLASDQDMSLVSIPHADGAGLFRLTVLNGGPQAVLVRNKSNAIAHSRSRTLPVGEPFHLAVTFQPNGRWSCWLNGQKLSELADHYGWSPPIRQAFTAIIGLDQGVPLSSGQRRGAFQGTLRELRISQTTRYVAPFKPAMRLESDRDTLALYHFDEGTGSELKDASGNNHHGKIVGAKWVKVDGSALSSNDPERAVAEWIINNGGDVHQVGQAGVIAKVADLPRQPFAVRHVDIRNVANFSEADAQRLTRLRELTAVYFTQTTLGGGAIRTLAGCRRLQTLLVSDGSTTDATLSEMLQIPQLRSFEYDNVAVTDEFVARLGQLTQLYHFQLGACPLVTAEGLVRLAAAPPPKLQYLALGSTKTGVSGLRAVARLPHLQELNIGGPQLDDAWLTELAHCPTLSKVWLTNTRVTQAGTTELQKALTGCQIFVSKPEQAPPLYGPAYRDTIRRLMARGFGIMVTTNTLRGMTWIRSDDPFPKGDVVFAAAASAFYSSPVLDAEKADLQLLAQLSDLQILALGKLPPDGLRELLPLKNLISLQIGSPLTDADIALLPSFPKLSTFGAILPSDAALETVAKLPHLSYLMISFGSKITDNGLKVLESARVLSNVDFGYTNISLAAAQSLANTRPDIIVTVKSQRLDPVETKPNAQAPPNNPKP
ncbi:MAG: protein kinase [Planctomycetales bacterium]|nr:protein kinase [Planctomycetales bacterium]